MEESFVIVIGRQFGSGGRTIGKILAEKLGIAYYDNELIDKTAAAEGINPEIFKLHDEKKPSVLKALLQGAYGIADNFHSLPLSSERIYSLQSKLIKDICKIGSCVIVGRNADYILRENKNVLSVFFHSPLEARARRIVERGEAKSLEEAMEMALQRDKKREAYYNFYTGDKKWGVASNYHLCLDTSDLDSEKIADCIIAMARMKFKGAESPLTIAQK